MITRIKAYNYRCSPKLAVNPDRSHVLSGVKCQDLAFNQLRDTLRAWFPEQQ
jgi:hypothetical protein